MFNESMLALINTGFWESIYMTLISAFFAYVIGLPLGLILVVTDKDGIRPMPVVYEVLGFVINCLRSVPFLILMMALGPFTRFLVGTSIGAKAAIVSLVISGAPFIARLVESSQKFSYTNS